jgi:superoxide dismutase, Fe-Mn family
MITRRDAIKTAAAATALASAGLLPLQAQTTSAPGPHSLPALPYALDALEPHIDARTMEIHHGKHHAAYVSNLNKAIAEFPDLAKHSPEDLIRNINTLPEKIRTAVRNNGGGHVNHTLFWQMLKKNGGGEPQGALGAAVRQLFGSYSGFQEAFTKAALGQFGSGWAWLTINAQKQLAIESTANQDCPLMDQSVLKMDPALMKRYGLVPGSGAASAATKTPLLGLDVWEHAYYLKYQNRRADYVTAFFQVINWDFVAERFQKATA